MLYYSDALVLVSTAAATDFAYRFGILTATLAGRVELYGFQINAMSGIAPREIQIQWIDIDAADGGTDLTPAQAGRLSQKIPAPAAAVPLRTFALTGSTPLGLPEVLFFTTQRSTGGVPDTTAYTFEQPLAFEPGTGIAIDMVGAVAPGLAYNLTTFWGVND